MRKQSRHKRKNYAPIFIAIFVALAAVLAYVGARLLTPEGEPPFEETSSSSEIVSSIPEEPSSSEPSASSQPEHSSSISEQPAPAQTSNSQTQASSQPVSQPAKGDWRLLLVSKNNKLDKELDVDLVDFRGFKVDKRIKDDLERMFNDAAAQGIKLSLVSTYRPFSRSAYLYDNKVGEYLAAGYTRDQAEKEASMWVAPPGTSEHVTGLAADIVSGDYYTKFSELVPEFAETKEAQWLKANCAKYGFILRYPEGKENITMVYFEPWHFRYVGAEHAQAIMDKGITLEEYLEQLGD